MNFLCENHAKAYKSAMDCLKPTQAQLEHGLELHRELFAMDHFGFLPSACWNHKIVTTWDELKEKYVGSRELNKRIEWMQYDEVCNDPECAGFFRKAMRASGLNCTIQTVAEGKSREEDIRRMACNIQLLRHFSDTIAQAGNCDDIKRINDEGKIAVVWSVNGPPVVGEMEDGQTELHWLDDWRRMGVRLMHLTYNRRNFAGDGCTESADAGLSDFGRELIERLNKQGIIVDVPHTGSRTSIEAAKHSAKPIMATHTAAKALFDFCRCKDDETLKAIADGGGMVGVYTYAGMVGGSDDLNQVLNHIEYISKLVGVDHVGIGTDLQYSRRWPEEVYQMRDYPKSEYSSRWWGNWKNHPHAPAKPGESQYGSMAWINWPLFTVGLVVRGFSDEDIAKILGQNFLRVFKANQE